MKKRLILSIAIVCILIGFVFVLAREISLKNKWEFLGQKVSQIKKSDQDEVIAQVNDKKIYKKDLQIALMLENLKYETAQDLLKDLPKDAQQITKVKATISKKTPREILNEMIEDEILFQQAQKEGEVFSKQEAEKYYNNVEKIIQNALSGNSQQNIDENSKKVLDFLQAYKKGLGLSDEEYKQQCILAYQKMFTISRYLSKKQEEDKTKNPSATQEDIEKYIKELKSSLRGKSKVII